MAQLKPGVISRLKTLMKVLMATLAGGILLYIGVYWIAAPYLMGCTSFEEVSAEEADMRFTMNVGALTDKADSINVDFARDIDSPYRVLVQHIGREYVVSTAGTGNFDIAGGLPYFYMPYHTTLYVFNREETLVAEFTVCSDVRNVDVRGDMLYFSWENWTDTRKGYGRVNLEAVK